MYAPWGFTIGENHSPKMTQKILAIQCSAFLDSVQTIAVFLNCGYEESVFRVTVILLALWAWFEPPSPSGPICAALSQISNNCSENVS